MNAFRQCAPSRFTIFASSTTSSSTFTALPTTATLARLRPSLSSSSLPSSRHSPNSNRSRAIHASSSPSSSSPDRHGTTIVCVRKNGRVCMMGDGMVSMGSIIVKPNAKKIRRIRPKSGGNNAPTEGGGNKKIIGSAEQNKEQGDDDDDGGTIVGFAGTTADAFTLLERLESKLDEHPGQLARSCVELAKGWRTDKYLRRLEASLLVADARASFEITGNGDVLESHDGVLGVGSGSPYAMAAARALMEEPNLSAEDVAKRAMRIASDMCVYTNDNFTMESMAVVETDVDEKRMNE